MTMVEGTVNSLARHKRFKPKGGRPRSAQSPRGGRPNASCTARRRHGVFTYYAPNTFGDMITLVIRHTPLPRFPNTSRGPCHRPL
jgi:hypothetical protein